MPSNRRKRSSKAISVLSKKAFLPPIDIVAANTQIATFEQNVYTAQETVTQAENTLKTLMLPDRTSEIWSRPITPVSSVSLDAPRIGLEIAIAEALKIVRRSRSSKRVRRSTRLTKNFTKTKQSRRLILLELTRRKDLRVL